VIHPILRSGPRCIQEKVLTYICIKCER